MVDHDKLDKSMKPGDFGRKLIERFFDNPPLNDVLCAEDVLAARLDRDAFGRVHPEIKYAVLLQIVRSVARDQIGANSGVKSLCEAGLTVCDEK